MRQESGIVKGGTLGGSTAAASSDEEAVTLVGVVAHELRGPLTPLKGYLLTLARGAGNEPSGPGRECLEAMLRQVGRLERLVDDLVDLASLERGVLRLETTTFDLRRALSEQVADLRAANPGRSIGTQLPLEPVPVHTDAMRVAQIVSNLVGNAIKYSPHGAPVLVSLRRSDGVGRIAVRDLGPGIPAAERARIFDPFHRGAAAAAGARGAGVGLFVAKRLAGALDGSLDVTTSPRTGTTFTLSLPLAPGHEQLPLVILSTPDDESAPLVAVDGLRETARVANGEAGHGEQEELEGHPGNR